MKSLLSLALSLLLVGPMFAASRPAVKDEAKLFSAAAVEQANRRIADIKDIYQIDLFVDTLKELPDTTREQVLSMRSRDQKKLYRKTAQELAEKAGVNGIYVLVTTEPRNVVLIGWPTEDRENARKPLEEGGGLSATQRDDRLLKPFMRELRNDPDAALLRLIDHFRTAVTSRVADDPSPLETMAAFFLVSILFAAWLVLSLLRRATVKRQAEEMGESAGTLYPPAMLGSLFGVAAGFWVYDRLFRNERPQTAAATAETAAPPISPSTHITSEAPAPAPVENTDEPVI
jgi:hypothetical protein